MIYLPPEIWLKIFKIYDNMRIKEKKDKFKEIHKHFTFESTIMTFLEYSYFYTDINSYWTPVQKDYRNIDKLISIKRLGCKKHRFECNCLNIRSLIK